MTSVDRHVALVRLIQGSESITWLDARDFRAELILTEALRHYLSLLQNISCVTDILIDGRRPSTSDLCAGAIGKKVLASVQLPPPREGEIIVQKFSDLLTYDVFLTDMPRVFYCVEDGSEDLPQSYKDVVKFASLVRKVADHEEKNGGRSICFLYSGAKLRIPIVFIQEDMCELSGLDELTQSFCAPHYDERVKFFRAVLAKIGMGAPGDIQIFPYLINKFTTIHRTFESDWNAYISDFSLEKVLSEVEEKNIKIADKITASLSDLQKTMITIPLAIIFAAPRVDPGGLQSWTNCLILLSVWLFALFTWAFFSSQKRSLQFIIDEIDEQKKTVEKMHPTISEKTLPKFRILEKRCNDQKVYRRVIGTLMWITVIVLTAIFFFPNLLLLLENCLTVKYLCS